MKQAGAEWDMNLNTIDDIYAGFGRVSMTDEAIMYLSRAKLAIPKASKGDILFLTSRSGCKCFVKELSKWAEMVAESIAQAQYKPDGRKNTRRYVEGYRKEWGAQAAKDGICLAMFGPKDVPGISARCEEFGVGKQGYQRIRDFVGGAAAMAIEEYRYALLWACGDKIDRRFDAAAGFTTKKPKKIMKWDSNLSRATLKVRES
jgi:hypothetical protein